MAFTVKAAECHPDVCLDLVRDDGHVTNVNPIMYSDDWRVDCDSCFTCIGAGFKTKADALARAKVHMLEAA